MKMLWAVILGFGFLLSCLGKGQNLYSSEQLKQWALKAYAKGDWRTGNVLRRQSEEVRLAEGRAIGEQKAIAVIKKETRHHHLKPSVTKATVTPSIPAEPVPVTDHRIKPWGSSDPKTDPPYSFY